MKVRGQKLVAAVSQGATPVSEKGTTILKPLSVLD
jgi:hypothetical protein